jgi:AcrR family transcriptional regulator
VTATPGATAVRRGRPRNADLDRAVIETVLTLLGDGVTFAEMSMEGIARAAGVGKATIYRRWLSKEALLFDVLATMEVPLPEPARRSVREDLVTALGSVRKHNLAKRESTLMRNMQSQIQSSPELWQRYYDTFIVSRRRVLGEILQRGIANGEIRAELGTDLDLLIDMVVGPLLTRTFQRPNDPVEEDLVERLVAVLLDGMGPRC